MQPHEIEEILMEELPSNIVNMIKTTQNKQIPLKVQFTLSIKSLKRNLRNLQTEQLTEKSLNERSTVKLMQGFIRLKKVLVIHLNHNSGVRLEK